MSIPEESEPAREPEKPVQAADIPLPPPLPPPDLAELPPPPGLATGEMPAPPPPRRRQVAAVRPATPQDAERQPDPAAEASGTEFVTIPKLTTVISEEERWAYNQEIDHILVRVNEITGELNVEALGEERLAVLDRVRAFVKRTIDTRESDLATALSLARRAEVLAKDLGSTRR